MTSAMGAEAEGWIMRSAGRETFRACGRAVGRPYRRAGVGGMKSLQFWGCRPGREQQRSGRSSGVFTGATHE